MASVAARITDRVNQRKQAVALGLLSDLVGATPKKTGYAAGNWQVTINGAASGVLPWIVNRLTPSSTPSAAISSGASTIQSAQFGQAIYITNNVPYIRRLNDGYSTQAPAGFIETSVARFHSYGARVSFVGGPDLG